MLEFSHKPVMLEECMQGLALKAGGIYFDGTVGGGGHSYEILKRTSPSGRLIATDLDDEAIAAATKRLSPFEGRFTIYKSNYKDFEWVFGEAGVDKVDGALLDFGVSSHQIDDVDRGFSYRFGEAPLDMRMDRTSKLTAETVLNTYSEEKLVRRGELRKDDCAQRRKIQGEQALDDLRRICENHSKQYSREISFRSAMRKEKLSGSQNRGQRGTRRIVRAGARAHPSIEKGRTNRDTHLSLLRGSGGEGSISVYGIAVYLSQELSRLRLRKETGN